MKYIDSPVDKIFFRNRDFYLKRDDLLDIEFSGNKARKFYYFINKDFKDIKKIVSYGSAQANSLYSLSVLAKIKNVKLDFYVSHIASYLKENACGNYKKALANGANIIEVSKNGEEIQEYIENIILPNGKGLIFIEEGGRVKEAEFGIKILAQEIINFKECKKIDKLNIFLPSGTGTTALYLQKNLDCKVYTTACVGDEKYLKKQFFHLEKDENFHPIILNSSKKYHFGKLYQEFYQMYQELRKSTSIEFDLLYDSLGWKILLENFEKIDGEIIYIHQGGLLGNESMLKRYENKYMLS